MSNSWFEVDKAGLAKIVAARGKVFVLYELLQNAFDEDGVTEIAVRFEPIPGRPRLCWRSLMILSMASAGSRTPGRSSPLIQKSHARSAQVQFGREVGALAVRGSAPHFHHRIGAFHCQRAPKRAGKANEGTLFKARMKMSREEFEQACHDVVKVIPLRRWHHVQWRSAAHAECVVSFEATLRPSSATNCGVRSGRQRTRLPAPCR